MLNSKCWTAVRWLQCRANVYFLSSLWSRKPGTLQWLLHLLPIQIINHYFNLQKKRFYATRLQKSSRSETTQRCFLKKQKALLGNVWSTERSTFRGKFANCNNSRTSAWSPFNCFNRRQTNNLCFSVDNYGRMPRECHTEHALIQIMSFQGCIN